MSSVHIYIVISVIIILVLLIIYLCVVAYRNNSDDNKRHRMKIRNFDETIEQKVKERTKQLEAMRDSVSDYAVQKFELAQELEAKNIEILQQKDYNAKQSEKLRIAYEEIKKLDAFRQQMVRMMIHDLKNPLNVILNLTDTSTIPSNPRSIIRQISFDMLDLIVNILEVQKFEEMKMKMEKENISVHALVNSLIERYSPLLMSSSIELKTNVSQALWINADRHIIKRILENLLGNAIKYTPSGGEIQINASLSGDMILIEVRDNGSGIQDDDPDGLFKMYTQTENSKNTSYSSSTGIGLAYCKLAVESLGGKIGISSDQGKGTSVWFTLKIGIEKDTSEIPVSIISLNVGVPGFGFLNEDLELLKPYITDLKALNICEVTTILSLTNKLDNTCNERIIRWKECVEETLFSANEKRYRELIDI
jgi:signal transduction histidine kinase